MRLPSLPERIVIGWALAAVALLLCLACGGNSGGAARGAGQVASKLLYVSNQSRLTTAEVQVGMASVQRQLDEEFRGAYQVEATLVLADPCLHCGRENAGYHDGVRTSWVATPEGWTEILSHEAIEMLVGNVCDPVQAPYSIPPGSPPVENFLLPGGGDFLQTR